MDKKVKLIALCLTSLSMSGVVQAQSQNNAERKIQDDSSDFTFTESQLDDDSDAPQTVSNISASSSDPYLSEVGYRFSSMRFRVRGYDNAYQQTYMNGLQLNDLEQGRFSFSMIGGMNDATRNQESVDGFTYNNFGIAGIGGANYINTRASAFAQGDKVTLSATNRNYVLRGMYTHGTGWLSNGWAFAGTLGYRWAKEGVIEGTFYNSFSYFLSAEKKLGENSNLSLVTFGSPTERAQQGASTEEAYALAGSHYYNPYWGYQNGKKRNSRVIKEFQPTAIATWDWQKDDKKLTTALGFKYAMYSGSAFLYANNAYNPAADYYKNLPSSVFNVYDPEKNNGDYLEDNPFFLEQYNQLRNYWTSDKAHRQVDWDRFYYVNEQNNKIGRTASYLLERRHNDQMVISLSPTWSHILNESNRYSLGLILNHTKGMHYKTIDDMLGSNNMIDIDSYATRDYGEDNEACQNDLRNPNRKVGEGDIFGYNYNILVNKAKLWGQYSYSYGNLGITLGGYGEGTTLERDGLMQNGRAKDFSYGKSGAAKFLGGGSKMQLAWRPFANHYLTFSASFDAQAPLARNAFQAPRIQNNFVDNLKLEKITAFDFGYKFGIGSLTGKVSAFYTNFADRTEQSGFYSDNDSRFYYLTMTGSKVRHQGIEAALNYQVNSQLSFNIIGSLMDAKYLNNPNTQMFSENNTSEYSKWTYPDESVDITYDEKVFLDGMKVSGSPQTVLSLGINYNINNWYLEANLNYYDRNYLAFSTYRRLGSILSSTNSFKYVNDATTGKPTLKVEYEANSDPAIEAQNKKNAEEAIMVKINNAKEEGGVIYYSQDGDGYNQGDVAQVFIPEQEKFKGGFMLDLSIGKSIRLSRGRAVSVNLQLQNVTNNTNMKTGGYEQNRSDFYTNDSERGNDKTYKFSKNPKYYYANPFNAFLNVNYRF